jgi:hypothetical protein
MAGVHRDDQVNRPLPVIAQRGILGYPRVPYRMAGQFAKPAGRLPSALQ